MLTITDGDKTMRVTRGAYEELYRAMGFDVVRGGGVPMETVEVTEEQRLAERPISKWSKAELKKFCEDNGINLQGASKVSDVRLRVKAYLEASTASEAVSELLEG